MTTMNEKRVCLGAVVGAHGIRGEVKVKSWTETDRDIGAYGALQNKDGTKSFVLKVTGHSKELLRCKIKGVVDRNAAEALIGTELYVNRDVLPQLEEEEYYQTDLIGLDVIEQSSGQNIGKVVGIYNFGAGDILEIKLKSTAKTEMIPFTKQYVPEVKIADGCVVISSALINFTGDDEESGNEG